MVAALHVAEYDYVLRLFVYLVAPLVERPAIVLADRLNDDGPFE